MESRRQASPAGKRNRGGSAWSVTASGRALSLKSSSWGVLILDCILDPSSKVSPRRSGKSGRNERRPHVITWGFFY